jgi:hypothetical protein
MMVPSITATMMIKPHYVLSFRVLSTEMKNFQMVFCGCFSKSLALVLVVGFAMPAEAQNFSVSPSVVQVSVAKGRTRTVNLEVEYFSENSMQVGLSLRDRNSAGFVDGVSALDWFSYEEQATLSEGVTTVPIEIAIPADTAGRYFFDLAIFVLENGSDQQDMVRLGYNISIDLTVRGARLVKKVEHKSASLTVRQLGDRFFTELTLEAQNVGNDLVTFISNYNLKRVGDNQTFLVARGSTQAASYRPSERGVIRALIPRRLPAGDYQVDVYLEYAGRRTPTSTIDLQITHDLSNAKAVELSKAQDIFAEPRMIQVELPPGATRSSIMNIQSYGSSQETLNISITENDAQGVSRDIGAVKVLIDQLQLMPGAALGVPVTATIPPDYGQSYITGTIDFTLPSGLKVASSAIYIGNQTMDRAANYEIRDIQIKKDEGPTPKLAIQLENVGDLVDIPDVMLVIRDSRLSTVHRDVLSGTSFVQPREAFTLTYEVIDRIRERPETYSVSVLNKGEALRRFDMTVSETGNVEILSD